MRPTTRAGPLFRCRSTTAARRAYGSSYFMEQTPRSGVLGVGKAVAPHDGQRCFLFSLFFVIVVFVDICIYGAVTVKPSVECSGHGVEIPSTKVGRSPRHARTLYLLDVRCIVDGRQREPPRMENRTEQNSIGQKSSFSVCFSSLLRIRVPILLVRGPRFCHAARKSGPRDMPRRVLTPTHAGEAQLNLID